VIYGVVLGGIGLYEPLIEFAGAGASVPLTGFGSLLAKGVREGSPKKHPGRLSGGMAASSAGISASIVFCLWWR
jgi:stage V sporulation protein AE